MKKNYIFKILFSLSVLLLSYSTYGQASDLFISEYSEGSSNNKYVEIYNGTGLDVDLSDYQLWRVSNGGTWPEATIALSGSLANGDVYVVYNGSSSSTISDEGDLSSSQVSFNGDDAFGLAKTDGMGGYTLIDAVGEDGADPGIGWDVASTSSATTNHTLVRKLSVTSPNTDWDDSRGTDASDSEWIVYSQNTWTYIGYHGAIWTGTANTDWATGTNWDTDIVPSNHVNAIIPDVTNAPIISGSTGASVINLTITEADGVTIESGGSLRVSGTSSGNITYNRNIPTTNWYLISSPVVGQDIDTFVATEGLASGTGNNIGLGDYNNTTPEWEYYQNGTSGTGDFISGDGRAVLLTATGNITFTGTLNTSDVNISITDATGSGGNAFNLVGNPYPSFIAANNSADATNNILKVNDTDNDYLSESTLWFWNQATNSYDLVNQTSSFFIAPGQAFFVSANGSHPFSFTEAMQSHQTSDTFKSSDNRPEINLVMTNGADVRDTDIYYIDGTTTGFDNGYDSSIFGGVTNEFAIYTQAVANGTRKDLGIQSLPDNDFENMIIPVGINATSGTEIIISATSANLPTGIHVYLEDKDDNSFTLLDDSSTFQTTFTNTSNGVGRFFIHTKTQPLSVDQADLNNVSIYLSDDSYLRIVGVQQGDAQVHIYSTLGKQVVSTSFEGVGVNDILLPNLSLGVYMVQLKTKNGKLNKKIIIQQ